MYCPYCKNQIDDRARFCMYCGTRIGKPAPEPAPVPSPMPASVYPPVYVPQKPALPVPVIAKKPPRGASILTLGIIAFLWLLPIARLILSIVALAKAKARKRALKRLGGMAVTGKVLAIVALVLAILQILSCVAFAFLLRPLYPAIAELAENIADGYDIAEPYMEESIEELVGLIEDSLPYIEDRLVDLLEEPAVEELFDFFTEVSPTLGNIVEIIRRVGEKL